MDMTKWLTHTHTRYFINRKTITSIAFENFSIYVRNGVFPAISTDKDMSYQHTHHTTTSVQFSSVAQSCPTLCDPMNPSTPGLPVHHQLMEFIQTHVHWVSDAIQPSHPLSSPSPPAPNPSQHHSLFQWVSSWHQVAKVLELQLQHQFFQWIFRVGFSPSGLAFNS